MRSLFVIIAVTFLLVQPAEAKRKVAAKPKAKTATTKSTKTLYERLGGQPALSAVVDQFVANCAGDARIASFFSGTAADAARMSNFKKNLVDQLCKATGGSCTYTGKDMKSAHFGMGVKNEHFDALVEDLSAALNQFKVPATEQAELIKILAPMRGQVVEAKS